MAQIGARRARGAASYEVGFRYLCQLSQLLRVPAKSELLWIFIVLKLAILP